LTNDIRIWRNTTSDRVHLVMNVTSDFFRDIEEFEQLISFKIVAVIGEGDDAQYINVLDN
jgi:hypothetical protein